MKFTYKNETELTAMTPEQRDIYSEQKRAYEAAERKAEFLLMFKQFFGLAKKADGTENTDEVTLDQLKAKMTESGISKEEFNEIKEIVNQWKESNGAKNDTPVVSIAKEVKANKDALKAIIKGGPDGSEVVLKANTVRASVATDNNFFHITGIGQLQRVKRALYDVFTKMPVPVGNTQGVIAYTDWDEATTVKAAAVVAEGAAFPESTAKFKGYTLPLRKIGDTLPVSEEFFEDEQSAAAELDLFLSANVASVIDDEIVNGDNTGEHLKGLFASVPAFVAVAAGIVDANIYDLITKVKSTISSLGGAKYDVNMAAMNQNTVDLLVLKKDANHNYQFPPNHPIFDMITVDNHIPDNEMVVGDARFGRIYEQGGIVLSQGMINAQFTSDLRTLKARKRIAFLIREADKTGFRKVTDITAALATLEGAV